MKLVIIKYNAGNIQSVLYALERIGVSALVTDEPAAIREADKVIFPGVGEASTAMDYLRERGLDSLICDLRQPILGICLGMQLMCSYSEENDTECMGIFGERVKKFAPDGSGIVLKVPQIGWNNIYGLQDTAFRWGGRTTAIVILSMVIMQRSATTRSRGRTMCRRIARGCTGIIFMGCSSIRRSRRVPVNGY